MTARGTAGKRPVSELTGRVRETHRGLLIESEHLGEVKWFGAGSRGPFELAVDAESFQLTAFPRIAALIHPVLGGHAVAMGFAHARRL